MSCNPGMEDPNWVSMTCGLEESTSVCSLYLCLQDFGLADFMSVTQVDPFRGGGWGWGRDGVCQLTKEVQKLSTWSHSLSLCL